MILRLGTAEFDGGPVAKLLRHFADSVLTVSSGRLTVTIVFGAAGSANDFETAVIDQVEGGAIDLGVAGTRAWDARRVLGLRALQAPFLVDGYPLLDQVLSGALAGQLLGTLAPAGYVGLGFLPDQLRHPLGFKAAITSPADFQGLHIRVPASIVGDALMRALGAVPEHLNGAAEEQAIDSGEVTAAETSVGNATPFPLRSVMTANVTFYPLVRTLFMRASRFAALSSTFQAQLSEAAAETQAWALAQDPESADVSVFCQTGGTFATATDASLAQLAAEASAVDRDLRADPTTASLIGQIQALKAGLSRPIPAACPR